MPPRKKKILKEKVLLPDPSFFQPLHPYKQRHSARQIALAFIYQMDVQGFEKYQDETYLNKKLEEFLNYIAAEASLGNFVKELAQGVVKQLPELDQEIATYLRQWTMERIANVDKAILRLSLFELHQAGAPAAAVIIDEAVELAKEYGTNDSRQFVNAVLDQCLKAKA